MSVERKYELYTHEAKANAYELFAKMRQNDPVHCQPGIDGETMIWFVTSYDEVEQVLRDDKHFVRDARHALPPEEVYQPDPLEAMMSDHMLSKDWGDHRRLRTLVSQAFTPGACKPCARVSRPLLTNCSTVLSVRVRWT